MVIAIRYIVVFIIMSCTLFALDGKFYIGPSLFYNHVFNSSEIPLFPNSAGCGLFDNGTSNSFSFGLNAGYVLIPNFIEIDSKLLYDPRELVLEKANNTGLNVFRNSKYQELVLKHKLEASVKYMMLDIGAKVYPIESVPMGVRVGLDISTEMFGNEYTNTESIDSPTGILFPDETRSHVIESGELDINSTNYGISLSLFGNIMQDSNFAIIPEISYRYQLNSTLNPADWYSNMLKVGVSAVWYMNLSNRNIERPNPIETELTDNQFSPQIIDSIRISNLRINKLKYLETTVTQTYPILPYIFFDSASAKLPTQITQYKRFDNEANLPKDNIQIYHHILDIIGSRMSKYSDSRLIIKGTTDGEEISDSSLRIKLAENRALAIRSYLSKYYNISEDRLSVKIQDIPDKVSSIEYIEGYEENRRVELNASYKELFKPVIHNKYQEITLKSGDIFLEADIENPNLVQNLEVQILLKDSVISSEFIDNVKNNFTYYKTGIQSKFAKYDEYQLRIIARDSLSNVITVESKIPVHLSKNDFEVARLNLIVFDFDSDEITPTNKKYLTDFLSSQISDDAQIKITGATDYLGGYEYNKELSLRRANAVRSFVAKYAEPNQIISCIGVGSDNIAYDINTPEGRFYCRTVLIEVLNPIKE